MKRIQVVIKNTRIHVKIFPNSPILRINHELDSIKVNKGRIHGELRYIFGIL